MSGRFGSVLTAMVTPFDAEGRVDVDTAVRLARWLVDQGNEGLVITGTTCAPASTKRRLISTALYAAIPPVTPSTMRLPASTD